MARVVRTDVAGGDDPKAWTPALDEVFVGRSWATFAEPKGGITTVFEDDEYEFKFEVQLTDEDLAEMGFVRIAPSVELMTEEQLRQRLGMEDTQSDPTTFPF